MARKRRLLKDGEDHDPMAVLTNLFDVAMVFAVALMVALVKNPGTDRMEIITKKGETIEKYTPSEEQENNGSRGRRVGTAYQLDSGEIIYVPE